MVKNMDLGPTLSSSKEIQFKKVVSVFSICVLYHLLDPRTAVFQRHWFLFVLQLFLAGFGDQALNLNEQTVSVKHIGFELRLFTLALPP